MSGEGILQQGFREIEHAADWEIEVWAPDLPGLFIEAARGLYVLSGTKLNQFDEGTSYEFEIPFTNPESILVAFLNELLFQSEHNWIGITNLELDINDSRFQARGLALPLLSKNEDIKAVTFHHLEIKQVSSRLETHIIFDV
jgi:SHS2 domain-containing protein